MSNSNGMDMERIPLRSLQNEMHNISTQSPKLKSRSLANSDAFNLTKSDEPLSKPKQQNMEKGNHSCNLLDQVPTLNTFTAETPRVVGDITFKSFACAGGEIEIFDHSDVAKHQASYTCVQEDTTISHSMISLSVNSHMDHPYCNVEEVIGELSITGLASQNINTKCDVIQSQNACCSDDEVAYKSFICDGGGEVEVADATSQLSESIPLPKEELVEQHLCNSVSLSIVVDDCDKCQQDHADHPYSSKECGLPYSMAQSPKPATSDITFKYIVCSGIEVEVSDGATLAEEMVSLPSVQPVYSDAANDESINQSIPAAEGFLQLSNPDHSASSHSDHCYFTDDLACPSGDLKQVQETLPSSRAVELSEGPKDFFYLSNTAGEVVPLGASMPLSEDHSVVSPHSHSNTRSASIIQGHHQEDSKPPIFNVKSGTSIEPDPMVDGTSTPIHLINAVELQGAIEQNLSPTEESAVPFAFQQFASPDSRVREASVQSSIPLEVEGLDIVNSIICLQDDAPDSRRAQDSALGLSEDSPVHVNPTKKAPAENPMDVTQPPKFPPVANTLQFELLSPVVRGTPLARIQAYKDSPLAKYLADEAVHANEKCLVIPGNQDPAGPFMGPLESPMPQPLFNSTALCAKYSSELPPIFVREAVEHKHVNTPSVAAAASQEQKGLLDIPLIPNGSLQQQLFQIAELLMQASGKISGATTPFPVPPTVADAIHSSGCATQTEYHSICVGTSLLKLVDHSMNTSGQFERKQEFATADCCTLTDPLLWNVPPGSLESLSKQELEQRLRSNIIMVEVLVQQLDTARRLQCPATGPAPSELRDKLMQTDHTELDQTSTYRDLYATALGMIQQLQLDQSSLRSLTQAMKDTKITMSALRVDTDAALSTMKQMGEVVGEDRRGLLTQYGKMQGLCSKFKGTQARMVEKLRHALQEREDMRRQRDEAFIAKDAAFSVSEQLRTHWAQQMADMEESVGSHQKLMAALNKTYPEQVALNKAYVESLSTASDLLTRTMRDHASLATELVRVRSLVKKAAPMLLRLNKKTASALSLRDQHQSERDQALEEKLQIQEVLDQAHVDLQDYKQQIGDLNLQATIMASEMGVLRGRLSKVEEERAQLERKATELSAVVSSTQASYAFLEQALASETAKLQQSRKDKEQANDKADQLEALLGPSQQRECELSEALALTEQQLCQLQTYTHSQGQQLQDACTKLGTLSEMNEFLQMESELTREQVVDSENTLRANLEALRERNIQYQDLKGAHKHLQREKGELEEELEATRTRAADTQQSLGEQLVQAVTDITVLLHTLRGLANGLHSALNDQKQDSSPDGEPQAAAISERRQHGTSFIDSIMVALATEKEEEGETVAASGEDAPFEGFSAFTSAFTRITPAVTPKKCRASPEAESERENGGVLELLVEMHNTVSDLVSSLSTLKRRRDAQLEEQHTTICILQEEQRAAASRHRDEVAEFTDQISRLNSQVEKGHLALQQKVQDEKTLMNLFTEINEARESLNKYKTENNELRRALQQSRVESRALREELKKAGGASANRAHLMDEKIQLLQQVERFKESLEEEKQTRTKLLDRAKRHQMIHRTNEQKMENELRLLDNMIEAVRKTLMSVPEVVNNCEELKKLVTYIS